MKTTYLFSIILFILSSFVFIACDDDKGDTERPTINLIVPANGDTLRIGGAVHLDMELSDNEMLASYMIDIHKEDGLHETKAAASGNILTDKNKWDVSGQKNKHVHHHEIIIPGHATEGGYHFMVYCLDAAGNESYTVRNVILSHTGGEHDH